MRWACSQALGMLPLWNLSHVQRPPKCYMERGDFPRRCPLDVQKRVLTGTPEDKCPSGPVVGRGLVEMDQNNG